VISILLWILLEGKFTSSSLSILFWSAKHFPLYSKIPSFAINEGTFTCFRIRISFVADCRFMGRTE
jgi:hypothetical protein